jgi:hypothetical protein
MVQYDPSKVQDIAFEAPLFESTKGLIGLMFQQVGKISDLIRDPSFNSTDGRLELMVNHLISAFIVETEEQDKFRKDMQELINEYTKGIKSNEEQGSARNRACLVFEGKVLSRLHDLLGTTKRNRVGIVWDPEKCKIVDFR